jgi:SsrA-binding protein
METKVVAANRGAKHQYEIIEEYEAGLSLAGSEVKSLRAGKVNVKNSYCKVDKGEMFVYNMHVSPYESAGHFSPNPKRKRKLLLHKNQIQRIFGKMTQKGLTVVPLDVHFNPGGKAKINIALVKKKQGPDKREKIRRHDLERELRESGI